MPEVPAVPEPRALTDQVERVFAPDGPIAAALDGYEHRPGQQRLALETARILESGGTLVAEAGTGIGKTFAYLVPAALSGRKVLISTGTRTLQDQVFYKDVPAVSRMLQRDLRAAYMKGRSNYLCRHRFSRLEEARQALPPDDRRWLDRVAEWLPDTETGDRAEIDDLPDDLPFWTELSATSEQCLGRDCPSFADCFVTRMRDRAAEADLVIVNHHLLCADAAVREGAFGEVIPECDVAIIDEAHQLEDVVTHYFGVSVSAARVEELVHDAARQAPAEGRGDREPGVSSLCIGVQTAARRLFDLARLAHRESPGAGDRLPFTSAVAARLHDVRIALDEAVDRLAHALLPEAAGEEAASLRSRAERLRDDLRTVTDVGDAAYVRFVEVRGRGAALRAAPIDASTIIRETILGRRAATVLTSATLTVEHSFEYILDRLGLRTADTLRLPSEFEYREQAILFLPEGMPDPRSGAFNAAAAAAIARILECTQGRAFVLFTSYTALREVHALLEPVVEWPLFVQGTAPRMALLRDFRATPHAVLLATSSFWQGVDVAGDALSCVIIDRLPFAVPADPIVAARIAAIEAKGGRPFHDYQVPVATLVLLQGIGRLIRSRQDRGVLAILDPRLTRMSYGRRFLASLPPAPLTSDMADVEAFLSTPRTPQV